LILGGGPGDFGRQNDGVAPQPSHPMYGIRFISLDYKSGVASIVTADGQIVTDRVTRPETSGSVTRSTFIPHESRMEILAAGELFTVNLGSVRERVMGPVVYLDQNHWIDFARWHKSPANVSDEKREFFDALASAATVGRIILPLSSAHLTETSKRGGTTRVELASTMLRYSRGWQMRSVLGLRRAELRALFGSSFPLTKNDVITLSPRAVFDMKPDNSLGQDLGPEIAGLLERQVWAAVLVSLLIDHDPNDVAGRGEATRWAQSFRPLATAMNGNAKAKAWSRDLTRTRFFSDLGADLPAAAKESGISPEQFSHWLHHDAESAIAGSPGLARMRQVMHLRLANSDDKWEANDLNDWMHLSYAAAYCDLVLGEKKTISYLRRSDSSVPQGASLHRRASDALSDLKALLVVDPNDHP
jgi:hypothetical protein